MRKIDILISSTANEIILKQLCCPDMFMENAQPIAKASDATKRYQEAQPLFGAIHVLFGTHRLGVTSRQRELSSWRRSAE